QGVVVSRLLVLTLPGLRAVAALLVLRLILSLRDLPCARRLRIAILLPAEQRLEKIQWTLRRADRSGTARPLCAPPPGVTRLRLRPLLGQFFGLLRLSLS